MAAFPPQRTDGLMAPVRGRGLVPPRPFPLLSCPTPPDRRGGGNDQAGGTSRGGTTWGRGGGRSPPLLPSTGCFVIPFPRYYNLHRGGTSFATFPYYRDFPGEVHFPQKTKNEGFPERNIADLVFSQYCFSARPGNRNQEVRAKMKGIPGVWK